MTIERQYNKIIFVCDVDRSGGCEGQIETGESDFTAAYDMAREEGWGAVPANGGKGWIHHCGKCRVSNR